MLVVTLHSPDGEEYGGLINKIRGGGIILQPTLVATSPGVDVYYDKSWAKGTAPNWHVHAEDEDIDGAHEIIMDLNYFAPGSPLWIHSNREFDKGESKIAEYMFMGCEVNGTVSIDGTDYHVEGIGHHQHSWSTGLIKYIVKGWDWCHVTLDNGWNIYYNNYYLTRQITPTKTDTYNPYGVVILTTDNGNTFTRLEDVSVDITKSDNAFLLLKIPVETNVTAEPKLLTQFLIKTYDVQINININAEENTYDHKWMLPTYVVMKIGRITVNGKVSWSDEDGIHSVDINGIGTIWNMRH
jgi:predicted secreted hydrolase